MTRPAAELIDELNDKLLDLKDSKLTDSEIIRLQQLGLVLHGWATMFGVSAEQFVAAMSTFAAKAAENQSAFRRMQLELTAKPDVYEHFKKPGWGNGTKG